MINHKHKFIYIHIFRSGGTSIEKLFDAKIHDHRRCNGYKREYGLEVWNLYFKFAFVRNPWSKTLGHYMWRQQKARYKKKGDDLNFRDWVLKFEENVIGETALGDRGEQQYNQLFCESGKQMVDYIGRFENLQSDFNIVCDKIGIPQQQLSHTNKTNHKHYTEYYDNETKQIVADRYAKDIDYFAYKFGD